MSAGKIFSSSRTYLPEHPHDPTQRQSELKTIFLGEVQGLLRGHGVFCAPDLERRVGSLEGVGGLLFFSMLDNGLGVYALHMKQLRFRCCG